MMDVIDPARGPYGGSVYTIINGVTGRTYIGVTCGSATRRLSLHTNLLRRNRGVSRLLQSDWDTYGEKAFLGSLIETVASVDELPEREAFWIAEMKRQGVPLYNHQQGPIYPRGLVKFVSGVRSERERKRRSRERRRAAQQGAPSDG